MEILISDKNKLMAKRENTQVEVWTPLPGEAFSIEYFTTEKTLSHFNEMTQ